MKACRRRRYVYRRSGSSHGSFHVPADEDYYFLYLYHCLVQKETAKITNLATKVREYLEPLGAAIGRGHELPLLHELTQKAPRLWSMLYGFMRLRSYSFTCPLDPFVGFMLDEKSPATAHRPIKTKGGRPRPPGCIDQSQLPFPPQSLAEGGSAKRDNICAVSFGKAYGKAWHEAYGS